MEADKKEKPKLKPSIKPKVLHHLHIKIYVFEFASFIFLYFCRINLLARQLPKKTRNRATKSMLSRKF